MAARHSLGDGGSGAGIVGTPSEREGVRWGEAARI